MFNQIVLCKTDNCNRCISCRVLSWIFCLLHSSTVHDFNFRWAESIIVFD